MNPQTYGRRGPRGCQGTLDKSFIHANSSEISALEPVDRFPIQTLNGGGLAGKIYLW
jgi:hypothetical protein